MKILALLVALLMTPVPAIADQEIEPPEGARIVSALVSGLDLDRLSPGLVEDIRKLAGTPLNRQLLKDLAARIETEHPRNVAAARVSQDPDGGARVVFVVARLLDPVSEANVNARYIVQVVEIRGVPEANVEQALRDALYGLAGRPLDSEEADRLEARLETALPDYEVQRRSVRGSQPGRIRLIFDVRRAEWSRWLRFEPVESSVIYHSDQGWGANLPLSMTGGDVHVTPLFVIDNGDDLIEEYSGFAVRVETRRLASERFGAFFEWSTFDQTWRDPTLASLALAPGNPSPYRNRMNFTPLLKFAATQHLTVGGGVSITELDPLDESDDNSRMVNAFVGAVSFSNRSRRGSRPRQDFEAAFTVRAGTESLESDHVYERYVGHAEYVYRWPHHEVRVSGIAGRINGDAPLFERFSLGDSRTLRGWDKYDIAPAGGHRISHASLEYQYRGLGMFLDAGSIWDGGAERRMRVSTGVTFSPGPVFFTVGFPVNTDEFRAVFTMGYRFPSPPAGLKKF